MSDAFLHLVIEDLGLSTLGLWNQSRIEDIENILADFLELLLDSLAVFADGSNVLIGTLGLFFLLNRGDDSP